MMSESKGHFESVSAVSILLSWEALSFQQINHERDSFISLLLSDLVSAGLETINFSNKTCERGDITRQLIRNFIVDCD